MKYRIEIAPLANYYVVAAKDKKTGELKESFTLNESAADILRLLCEEKDLETIAEEMSNMYDAPAKVIMNDIMKLTEELKQKGLI
jgi:hypothetical protein